MKYQSYSKCIGALIACGCLVLLGTVLFHGSSLAYAKSTLATPTSRPTIISIATPQAKPTSTVIVVSQPSSFSDPSLIIAIIGIVVQAVTLVFIIKYVSDTASMAKATRDSADATLASAKAAENTLQEMKEAREEESSPFVVVYFNYIHSQHQSLYLVVENIGKRIARDIQLEFTPPLQVSQFNKDTLENNTLLKKGIKSLVPNYKIPIPFDYLMHYFGAKLPMEYTVKVTFWGNPSLPPIELEYPLDLSHFNYIHFVTETGLGEIDNTLHQLANNLSSYTANAEGANSLLNHIANALNRGIVIKNCVPVSHNIPDIPTLLKEFVYLWVIYGKQREKFNKSFIFELRAKAVLISEELLNVAVALDSKAWTEQLKRVISNLSQLGSMELTLDGPEGVMFTLPYFLGGSSKEEFDNLGDGIVADINTVIELIEKEKETSLNGDNEEAATQSIVKEAD